MTTGPDLIVQDLDINALYWVAGIDIRSSWVVVNQGDAPVTTTSMAMYLSTDMTITTSDTQLVLDGATGFLNPGDTNADKRPGFRAYPVDSHTH